jgi:hypothetical protein
LSNDTFESSLFFCIHQVREYAREDSELRD